MQALAAISDGSDGDGAAGSHGEDDADEEEAEEEHPEENAEVGRGDAPHDGDDGEKSDTSGMATTLVLGADDVAKMSDVDDDHGLAAVNEVPDLSPLSESGDSNEDDEVNKDPLTDTDNESRSPWEKTGYKDKKGRFMALVARNLNTGNTASASDGSVGGGAAALCEGFFGGRVFCQGEGCVHCQKVSGQDAFTTPPTKRTRYFVDPKSAEKTIKDKNDKAADLEGMLFGPPNVKVISFTSHQVFISFHFPTIWG